MKLTIWQREWLREAVDDYEQRERHYGSGNWPFDRLLERIEEILTNGDLERASNIGVALEGEPENGDQIQDARQDPGRSAPVP